MFGESLTDEDEMPFGKHKGKKMRDVPAEYLDWLRDQAFVRYSWPKVYGYIRNNANVIDSELDEGEKPF